MNGTTRPPDPELLGFLQSLVNERNESPAQTEQQERTDSDKENDRQQQQNQDTANEDGGGSKKDDIWDDFYNEEDFQTKKSAGPVASTVTSHSEADEQYGRERFESLERVDEEEEEELQAEAQGERKESISENDGHTESPGRNSREKIKKKRRLFVKVKKPTSTKRTPDLPGPKVPTASGGSHPNLSAGRSEKETTEAAQQQETMSETSGRGGRRLSRRKQVARPRCAGPHPSGDVLQQKYQELQTLMVRPLVEPGHYVLQTRQQLRRLEGLSRQYAEASNTESQLPPTGTGPSRGSGKRIIHRGSSNAHHQSRGGGRRAFVELSENNTEEGYAVLRTVQVTNHAAQRPQSAQNRKPRPSSAKPAKHRPLSASQLPPATGENSRDRVLDYVTNSGNPRGNGVAKTVKKQSKATKTNSTSNNNNSNSNNTDTGESNYELSTSSNQKKSTDSDSDTSYSSDEDNKVKNRRRSSSSDRSQSGENKRSRGYRGRSASSSPYGSPHHTDTHLKHSNNPALRKWLRQKNKEHRQKKREEKAQLLAETLEKAEEKRKRDALFADSDKKVKEWMVQKRKEASKRAREERKRKREEEKEKKEREEIQQQYNSPFRLTERPNSSHGPLLHQGRNLFIPIIRPEGTTKCRTGRTGMQQNEQTGSSNSATENTKDENEEKEHTAEPKIPHPPVASKFVYKRPVSGRVRLMKLQKERKEDAKRSEVEKKLEEKRLVEEKEKKMRMSYDQWLLKKRADDYAKRQDAARQRALAKSDPELERIVPEVARRRIENIQRGKRRVTTGDKSMEEEVNKSFGGGDFSSEGEGGEGALHRLRVSGSHASLKQRPSSAKASLNPRVSKSPRRPQSAHPRVQVLMEENDDTDKGSNAFKLPFPPENGAPKHVIARQEKLFAQHLTHPPEAKEKSLDVNLNQNNSHSTVVFKEHEAEANHHNIAINKEADEIGGNEVEENNASFFVTDGNIDIQDGGQEENSSDEKGHQEVDEENILSSSGQQESCSEDTQNVSNTLEASSDTLCDDGNGDYGSASDGNNLREEEKVQASIEQEEETQQPHQKVNPEDDNSNIDDCNQNLKILVDDNEENKKVEYVHQEGNEDKEKADTQGKDDTISGEGEITEGVPEAKSLRHSNKHVSFQEEAVVFEPPSLSDYPDDEEEDADFFEKSENQSSEENYGDKDEDDHNDDDDEYEFDDYEAEDERGNYFGDDTPRDDF